MKAETSMYLNEDKTRLVPAGDPDARWVHVFRGDEISDADMEKYGLKEKPRTADKQAKPRATKTRKKS